METINEAVGNSNVYSTISPTNDFTLKLRLIKSELEHDDLYVCGNTVDFNARSADSFSSNNYSFIQFTASPI